MADPRSPPPPRRPTVSPTSPWPPTLSPPGPGSLEVGLLVHLGPRSEAALGCSALGAPSRPPPSPARPLSWPGAPCTFLRALHIPWDSELGPSAAPQRRPSLPPLSILPVTRPPDPRQKGACWELTGNRGVAELALASAPPTSPPPHTNTRARRGAQRVLRSPSELNSAGISPFTLGAGSQDLLL